MIERPWFIGLPDPWVEDNLVIYTDPDYLATHPEPKP
jgi:hypothetical protein